MPSNMATTVFVIVVLAFTFTSFNGAGAIGVLNQREAAIKSEPFQLTAQQQHVCQTMKVTTDKTEYNLEETVEITVIFAYSIPGCTDDTANVFPYYQVRLQLLDAVDNVIHSWQWQTDGNLQETVEWRTTIDTPPGSYAIIADEWRGNQLPEVMTSTVITLLAQASQGAIISQWLPYVVVTAVVISIIIIWLARRRYTAPMPPSPFVIPPLES